MGGTDEHLDKNEKIELAVKEMQKGDRLLRVMAGLVPAIHVLLC